MYISLLLIKLLLLLGVIVPPDRWMVELSEGLDPQIGYHFCSCWDWCRNSIPTTCHYPDLGGASDWSGHKENLLQPIRSTTQIWEETRHQYGFLRSFLRCHLEGKPVVTSRNDGCFLGRG